MDKRPLSISKNKKVIGLFKGELGGKIMKEFCALRSKAYAYRLDDDTEEKKAKGTKKCVVKREITFKNYMDSLFIDKVIIKSQQRFRSDHHRVYTEEVNKIALSSNDDKRLQTFDKVTTFPCGTNAFKMCESEMLSKIKLSELDEDENIPKDKDKDKTAPKTKTTHKTKTKDKDNDKTTPKTKTTTEDKDEATLKTKTKDKDKDKTTPKTKTMTEDKDETTPKIKTKDKDKDKTTPKTKTKDKYKTTPKTKTKDKDKDNDKTTPKTKTTTQDKDEAKPKTKTKIEDKDEDTDRGRNKFIQMFQLAKLWRGKKR